MKKIYYNKLVRDRIPLKIRKNGGRSKTYRLTAKRYEEELLKKVSEEASGVSGARTRDEIVSEIADLIDVLDEVRRLKKIKPTEIAAAQTEAFAKKGGFKRRLYLVWSSDTGYRSNGRAGRRK